MNKIEHEMCVRVREDHWHNGLVQVKVWVTHLPVDFTYGASGPDHDNWKCFAVSKDWRTDRGMTAQRCAYVPGDAVEAGVASAYSQLLDEYQEEETTEEGERYVFNRFDLPNTVDVLKAFRLAGRPVDVDSVFRI